MELSYGLSYKSLCIVIEELDSFFFFLFKELPVSEVKPAKFKPERNIAV